MLTVYVGYDKREDIAYQVCKDSILRTASKPVNVYPLKLDILTRKGLINRPIKYQGNVMIDCISGFPQSTEFAISRFLTPIIHPEGWAIFMDCDMVLLEDIYQIEQLLDPSKAVMVVKHNQQCEQQTKMDNQPQLQYNRKNWSSVIAFNCDHPSNKKLTIDRVSHMRGLHLHTFTWLKDEEIGELPPEWNWLVNVNTKPDRPIIVHFTLGGPWFDTWEKQPYDQIWLDALEQYKDS